MILVKPSFEIKGVMCGYFGDDESPLILIEESGRTAYKSEDKISEGSAEKFIKMIRDRGHESVLEHSAMTIKFICDRGVSHELVRHRLVSFTQESTRYVNYKGGCTFIIPPWINLPSGNYDTRSLFDIDNITVWDVEWFDAMQDAEDRYVTLSQSWTPQQARSVLPNSTKTEIVMTANFREWRHIFKLRCSKAAHPQMRELMIPTLQECKKIIPIIFDDIGVEE